MSDNFQLNLGSLRSSMKLTLHTHHAARIWSGRPATEGKNGIIGLSGFVSIMNKMKKGAEQDDPYSDWWMIRVEERLLKAKEQMKGINQQLDEVMAKLPPALSIGDNLNVHPVSLPLFVNAQLGFMAVYLLTDYDDLTRRLLLAHHTALIGRRDMEHWIDEGAHILRSVFGLAQQYKFSGASRDDFAANNAVARAAREKFGELPQDVLEGSRRSEFAPPIIKGSGSNRPAMQDEPVNHYQEND
ncbi:integrating conjugative element protein [Pseudomonas luteola]|uniref:Integrating conjugative element protein n=1 Tax=Pseudomonas luteola TaxID=47886 RepID=A0A2X2C6K0_PSELU|nr:MULTISPECIES: TIGR03761 family integrating conjugative element protein [Pseudomonas]SPZ02531.1 integrating conjugative element protein [Pseudomonas luteola]